MCEKSEKSLGIEHAGERPEAEARLCRNLCLQANAKAFESRQVKSGESTALDWWFYGVCD